LVFEDAEGDVDELAHNGADHTHFGFASGAKSASEVTQRRVVFDGHQGRHVQGLAQVAVASVATHRATAFFTPWSQTGMSRRLTGR